MATDIAMAMVSNLAVNLLPIIIFRLGVTVLELVSFAFDTRLPLGPNYGPALLSLPCFSYVI